MLFANVFFLLQFSRLIDVPTTVSNLYNNRLPGNLLPTGLPVRSTYPYTWVDSQAVHTTQGAKGPGVWVLGIHSLVICYLFF